MMSSWVASCLALTILLLPFIHMQADEDPATCLPKYAELENHTMCLHDDPTAEEQLLEPWEKELVVKVHNDYRANVDPPAARMQKMVYDELLATVAQKWTMQCQFGHDDNREEPEYPGTRIVQNMGVGYTSFQSMLDNMYDEKYKFQYSYGDSYDASFGHFYQMVFEGSARVGCGRANCPNREKGKSVLACNYAIGMDAGAPPYPTGESCELCPDTCDDSGKLCDCEGLICLNGGTVDVNSCTCQCTEWWKGPRCEQSKCINGFASCDTYPDKEKLCGIWRTVCPARCGVC